MENSALWILFLFIGLGTFFIRLSFVHFYSKLNGQSQRINRFLRLLPPAILATLCIPAIFAGTGNGTLATEPGKLIAAFITIITARYCNGVFWPILAGMGGLWASRWLL